MLKQKKWKVYGFWIGLSLAVGLLSALLSRPGMEDFQETVRQPPLSPPAFLFPVVWTALYILMGVGAAMVRLKKPSAHRSKGINLFVAQLVINFFWSLIFFNAQPFGFAFLWLLLLWALILLMILSFYKTDKLAALLQIPYLLWVTFAGYLNFTIWQLNR